MKEKKEQIETYEPHSVDAERSLLGAMIMSKDAIEKVITILTPNAFYLKSHRQIFETIVEMYESNEVVDVVTLAEKLRDKGILEEVGGKEFLANLLESVVSLANIEYYARIVADKAVLREMIQAGKKIIEAAYAMPEDVDETLDEAEKLIFSIKEKRIKKGFVPVRAVLTDVFEMIEKAYRERRFVTGIPSGFNDLDKYTAGFHNSEFIVLAARPGMGKTAFALNIIEHLAVRSEPPVPVAFFSLEMSKEHVVQRLLCMHAQVGIHKVRTGNITQEDLSRLYTASGNLSESPIFIDDTPAISILELRAKARRLKSRENVKLIIIDYLQLITSNRRMENRQQEISFISRSLKDLAKELDVPVIAVSQLSRAAAREKRPPKLSDLRESGAIEQDADIVIFLHKPETETEQNIFQVIIGKNRNGPVGITQLYFQEDYTRFVELERQYEGA